MGVSDPAAPQGCPCAIKSCLAAAVASQRQHPLDVVGQLPEALADSALTAPAEQVHHLGQ
jgi:hypothetical protein